MYNIMYETSCQSRFDAQYWKLGAGALGRPSTSRNIRDRLEKELMKDVSLHVTEQDNTDAFNVAGRGEMHLSILMETMRREGYEFSVSTPRVLTKVIDGKVCEPIERMVADVPEGPTPQTRSTQHQSTASIRPTTATPSGRSRSVSRLSGYSRSTV